MHTAALLDAAMFSITIDGNTASRESLLPDWHPHDRLGVVIDEPFGAVGAGHLIQLAITAFYDSRPSRRAGKPVQGNPSAIYPEIYLFHVGGRYGDHSYFDFWPARKEVFVENKARSVLDAINDRAITRLAVPDGPRIPIEHEWKEPAAARDRIANAFAYGPAGYVADADVEIRGLVGQTEFNARKILDPDGSSGANRFSAKPMVFGDPELEARSSPVRSLARVDEGRAGLASAIARRNALRVDGVATERYRRIGIDDALEMLVSPNANDGSW